MLDVIYIVHYPIYEDSCIQYADAAFVEYDAALAFAVSRNSRVTKVEVLG